MQHDGTRFEDREVIVVAVDDGRDAAVRAQLEEGFPLLHIAHDGDMVGGVRYADFLEQDRDFLAVRRCIGIQVNHEALSSLSKLQIFTP